LNGSAEGRRERFCDFVLLPDLVRVDRERCIQPEAEASPINYRGDDRSAFS
jgi:hypothetical protein